MPPENNQEKSKPPRAIRLRAERKAGQLLARMPKANGAREPGTKRGTTQSADVTASLADLGITKNQSSQWQKLGAMAQRDFDLAIGTAVKPMTPNDACFYILAVKVPDLVRLRRPQNFAGAQ